MAAMSRPREQHLVIGPAVLVPQEMSDHFAVCAVKTSFNQSATKTLPSEGPIWWKP